MTTPGEPCPCCLQAQEDIKAAVAEAREPLRMLEALAKMGTYCRRPDVQVWHIFGVFRYQLFNPETRLYEDIPHAKAEQLLREWAETAAALAAKETPDAV
jgi:hypothetical protein